MRSRRCWRRARPWPSKTPWPLAELLGESGDIDLVLRAYEKRRRPRVETIRATVRHRTVARGLEGPATPELLEQHRPVLSASLKVYDEMIDDPFARS